MQRIGIDCRLAGLEHAGIGRYVENLVRRVSLDESVEWVLFFHNPQQARSVLPGKFPNVKRVYIPVRHYSLLEQIRVPWFFFKERLSLLHVPHFNIPFLYPGKMVVTIHDLLWHEQRGTTVTTLPAWQYWLKYMMYRVIVKMAVTRARRIFVPTKSVASTLLRYYPKTNHKIVITPEGVASAYDKPLKPKSSNPEKRLVYTGSLYPHKNVKLIIQALPFLPEFTLTLVGSRTVFQDQLRTYIAEQGMSERVEFAGRLSDGEIRTLYQKAYALVLPSLSEGFGLPGLEAMAAGLPVVASDIPVFREVYGPAAAYFDPYSVAELVETLRVLEPSRATLVRDGKQRVKRFRWEKMAEQTLAHYQAVL